VRRRFSDSNCNDDTKMFKTGATMKAKMKKIGAIASQLTARLR
jgi:hypothetical protein